MFPILPDSVVAGLPSPERGTRTEHKAPLRLDQVHPEELDSLCYAARNSVGWEGGWLIGSFFSNLTHSLKLICSLKILSFSHLAVIEILTNLYRCN